MGAVNTRNVCLTANASYVLSQKVNVSGTRVAVEIPESYLSSCTRHKTVLSSSQGDAVGCEYRFPAIRWVCSLYSAGTSLVMVSLANRIMVMGVDAGDSLIRGPAALFSLLSKKPLLSGPAHLLSPWCLQT